MPYTLGPQSDPHRANIQHPFVHTHDFFRNSAIRTKKLTYLQARTS